MFEGENLQETCFCHQIRRLPVNHPAKKKESDGRDFTVVYLLETVPNPRRTATTGPFPRVDTLKPQLRWLV